jgi:2',3'-cyclic-nucleotide 2'-phosphodiesterase (5'-nucleotidase family)
MNNNYMKTGNWQKGLRKAAFLSLSLLLLSFSGYSQSFSIKVLSELTVPNAEFDEGATEIPAYFPGVDSVFITDGQNGIVRIIDISNPANPVFTGEIDFTTDVSNDQGVDASALGINSVAFNGSLVALAIEYENTMMVNGQEVEFQDNGFIALYSSSGTFITSVTAGSLPDMLTFTSSGDTIVVANEGEPSEDYSVDPEGSVSIIDVTTPSSPVVATADFTSFNKAALNAAGVRIFGPNATAAQDLEPEYVTIRNDTAYVSCQENNALAIVELSSATVLDVVPLGYKDFSTGNNKLDASNRDDQINIQNWPVFGMYQPDAIESFEVGGETYLVTANEGDARDYDGFSEEFRIGDLLLETGKFAPDIQDSDQLGRLRTTSALGLSNKEFIVQSPLTGNQEVPEVTTNASGTGEVRLVNGTATFRLTVQGIDFSNVDAAAPVSQDIKDATATTTTDDDFTRLHIHTGDPSSNGGIIHFFYDQVVSPVIAQGGDSIASISYSLNPDDNSVIIEGEFIGLDEDFLAAAKAAQFLDTINYYFNLHTVGNPGGEIRGNLNRGKALYNDEDEDRGFAIYDTLYSYGARSFSIWKVGPSGPERVYDSEDDFEQITAQRFPAFFNSTNDENVFDNRSDDKGPEPEGVVVGKIGSETYAFIGLERIGGVMVYNITDPMNPHFENYVNNRDFSVTFGTEEDSDPTEAQLSAVKDLGPEGLVFIPAADSPNNSALLAVTNEVSGTFTIYELNNTADYTLTVLHNNDGESNLFAGNDQPGGIARFKTAVDSVRNEQASLGNGLVMLSSGDNILPGRQLDAGLRRDDGPIYDAFALDEIGYDALAIGNHEFDFGVDTLAQFISDFRKTRPTFLSANLNFSAEQVLQDLVDAGRIAPSVVTETAGDSVGIIGLTTDALRSISSPEGVVPSSMLAESVNEQVTNLTNQGVNKIILISHLQNISNDTTLIKELSGVDIVIAGGGDELLSNDGNPVLSGDEEDIAGSYPLEVLDKDDEKVYVITTKGSYEYLGRLTATFNENGVVTSIEGNPIAITSNIDKDPKLKAEVEDPIEQFLLEQNNNVVGTTEVTLTGTRGEVRTRETNFGNLITDAILFQANRLAANANVDTATLALQNGGGIRNSVVIEPGNITEGNTIDALPFANFVSIVEAVPADTLKLLVENAVSGLPDAEGRFAQLAGFTVVIDTSRNPLVFETNDAGDVTGISQPGERVASLILNDGTVVVKGGEVQEVGPFNIATNSFSAAGGDNYPFPNRVVQLPSSYQRALLDYITAEDGLDSLVTRELYPDGGEGRITFNALPVAENVTVTGEFKVGEELTGSYVYSDADGDEEAGTTFAWVRADNASGTDATAITGATATTYTLTAADEGSFIAFQVLPRAATGVEVGVRTSSAFGGAVVPNEAPVATNLTLDIEGNGTLTTPLTGDILAVAYLYSDEEGDPEGETRIQWLANNTPISGATEASYTLTENEVGSTISAAITPVAQTGTLQGSAAFSDNTGAVEEGPNSVNELLKSIGVSVYPNPVTENLSFDIIGRESGNYTFRLYDALGKLHIERRVTKATSIKLGNLQPGAYFMQVIDERTETNVRARLLVK